MTAPRLSQYYSDATGDGRAYKHPFTGDRVPSITTCLKYENKEALIQWACNIVADYAAEHWQELSRRSNQAGSNYTKYAWKKFRDDRAEVGTGVHETIEALIKDTWEFPELNDEQEAMVENWHRFNEEYTLEMVHSEITLWSHTHGYAGTADGLGYVTGPATNGERKLMMLDWKTSKNVWPAHWMQLAALKHADTMMVEVGDTWEEVPMVEVEDCGILHVRADTWGFHIASEEAVDIDLRFEQFLLYRGLWGVDQMLKQKAKAIEKAKAIDTPKASGN